MDKRGTPKYLLHGGTWLLVFLWDHDGPLMSALPPCGTRNLWGLVRGFMDLGQDTFLSIDCLLVRLVAASTCVRRASTAKTDTTAIPSAHPVWKTLSNLFSKALLVHAHGCPYFRESGLPQFDRFLVNSSVVVWFFFNTPEPDFLHHRCAQLLGFSFFVLFR